MRKEKYKRKAAPPKPARKLFIPSNIPPERLQRLLWACRHQWEMTGDPVALIEALHWLRPRLPSWFESALAEALSEARSPEQRKAHHDNERHAYRFMQVEHFASQKKAGGKKTSLDEAFHLAEEELAGTWASGGWETMKASHRKVKADLEAGLINKYQIRRERHQR